MLQARLATVADIALIRKIAFQTWPTAYGNILREEQILYMLASLYSEEALQRQMLVLRHQFLFASFGNEESGFASFSIKSSSEETHFRLHKLYVNPQSQKTGAGQFLLNEVIVRSVASGGEVISLNVNRNNNAKAFYEKNGFQVSAVEDIDIGEGFYMNDYVMTKQLDKPAINKQAGAFV